MPTKPHFVHPEPPRTPKSAATRELLLDIAAGLFIERGYHAVSMQDVATEAELTKGAIYGHFRSKGQLLVEVIRWKLAVREQSAYFAKAMSDGDRQLELFFDKRGRDIRLLEVDAAAAARHDPDVAAGMRALYAERQRAIAEAAAVTSPNHLAWAVEWLAGGIGMKEAIGMTRPTREQRLETLRMLVEAVTR